MSTNIGIDIIRSISHNNMTMILKPCLFHITSKTTFDHVAMLWVLCQIHH